MKLLLSFLAAIGRMLLTLPTLLIGALGGLLSPSAASPAHNPNWLRDKPLSERLKWMFESKTEKDRQVGLTMPEIMLGLALIAVVTAGGLLAYREVAPRVTVNNMMAGLNPFSVDVTQFNNLYYSPTPNGIPRGSAQQLSSTGTDGWGTGKAASAATISCTSIEVSANATCTNLGCGTPTTAATSTVPQDCTAGTGTGTVVDPNYSRLSRVPSLQLSDGTYDADQDLEWHVPIGADDAIEIAFVINPTTQTPFTAATNGDFTNCGAAIDHSMYFMLAVDGERVCNNLSIEFERQDYVSQAWCDGTVPIPANTEGDIAMLACVPAP